MSRFLPVAILPILSLKKIGFGMRDMTLESSKEAKEAALSEKQFAEGSAIS